MYNMVDFDKSFVIPVSAGKTIPLYVLKDKARVKEIIKAELDKLRVNYSLEERNPDDPRVPDLMLEANDDGYFFYTNFDAKEPVSEVEKSTHDRRGVIIAHGESFKEGEISGANLIDLGPTVLHYFGVAIPAHYEGKVLDVFRENSEPAKRKVSYDREKAKLDRTVSKLKGKI